MARDPALKAGIGDPAPPAIGAADRETRADARLNMGLNMGLNTGLNTGWADLAENAAEANAFYAPPMLRAALDHLAGGQTVRLLETGDGQTVTGLMPIVIARRHGRLPVANVTNWMHPHGFFGAPLLRRGCEQAAWAGFLEQLDAAPWAPHFLHLSGIDAAGANAAALEAVCAAQARPLREIGRYDRALLRSDLSASLYWDTHVRAKKRKEIRRLQNRLADMGDVRSHILSDPADLPGWCDIFLALEASGWKGREGTALSCAPHDAAFFRAATAAACITGDLHFLRLDLDGRAIAMLVNFRHGRGAFSFKIAIDEALGRFSPGVLIEIANLHAVQDDPGIDWMDSCAAPGHPMIDSLWAERRSIVQYRVALRGAGVTRARRRAAYALAGLADRAATIIRGR